MGTVYVILAGIFWGTMGIFVRGLAACDLSSLEICFIRVFTSSIMVGLFLPIYNKSLLKIRIKDLLLFMGSGIFSLTMFGFCYFTTIQMTSLSVAAVLLYTSPIFVLILSAIFFKDKITKQKVFCIVLAVIGCIFVTGLISGNNNITVTGLLFGLMSGFGYGLYSIFGRALLNKKYNPLTITFYSFFFSAIALMFMVKPVEIFSKITAFNAYRNLAYTIGTAIIVTILPYVFYTVGLQKVENSKAAVYACVEPVMATLVGFVVFHEMLNISDIIGVSLILFAIILLNFEKSC